MSVSEPKRFVQCNTNLQDSEIIDFMRVENAAIVYQKHKSIGTFYKSREYTFIRFVIAQDGNLIMLDKSIDYQMKGGYTVQAGNINSGVWIFTPHPDYSDTTIMTLSLDMINNGFNNADSDSQITLKYLQSFDKL